MPLDAVTIPIALGIGQPALPENSIELCRNCYLQRESAINQFGQPVQSISPYRIVPASALSSSQEFSDSGRRFEEAINAVGAGRWGEKFVFIASNKVYVLTPTQAGIGVPEEHDLLETTNQLVDVVAWSVDDCLLLVNGKLNRLFYDVDGSLDLELVAGTIPTGKTADEYFDTIPAFSRIIFFNDRLCAITPNGLFYCSDLPDTSGSDANALGYNQWNKLAFTPARKPDEGITAIIATNKYVWTATAHTLTPHEDVGSTPFPFRSVEVFSADVGVLKSHNMVSYDGELFFRSSRGDVLAISPQRVRRLSNQRIQDLLDEDTHFYVIIDDARPMLCCSFGEGALVFNLLGGEEGWHHRDSFGKYGFISKADSWIISTDLVFGKLERYSLERPREIITAPMSLQNELKHKLHRLIISGTFGKIDDPDVDPNIYVSDTIDGYDFSAPRPLNIGKRGEHIYYGELRGYDAADSNKRSFKIEIPKGVPFQLTRLQAQMERV